MAHLPWRVKAQPEVVWVAEEDYIPQPHLLTKAEQSRGGKTAASRMTPEQRRVRAQKAGRARGRRHG